MSNKVRREENNRGGAINLEGSILVPEIHADRGATRSLLGIQLKGEGSGQSLLYARVALPSAPQCRYWLSFHHSWRGHCTLLWQSHYMG